MKKIDQYVYKLFLKHGSECLWISDQRVPRPRGTTLKTDEMFNILEAVDHRFEMIACGMYSIEMTTSFQNEIEELRPKISEDIFELMKKVYL